MTTAGGNLFAACFALVGGLEGYLLTMAYRYIGDDDEIDPSLRQSASRFLSLLGVIAVNPVSLVIGSLITGEVISCVNPA